jgi:hypothetical protein
LGLNVAGENLDGPLQGFGGGAVERRAAKQCQTQAKDQVDMVATFRKSLLFMLINTVSDNGKAKISRYCLFFSVIIIILL